jgi:hypothetical protein
MAMFITFFRLSKTRILDTVNAQNCCQTFELNQSESNCQVKGSKFYGILVLKHLFTFVQMCCRFCKEQFGEYVDYWITFNEPHIFVILTHCSGTWPPGNKPSTLASLLCFTPWGHYGQAMNAITRAHIAAFDALNEGCVSGLPKYFYHCQFLSVTFDLVVSAGSVQRGLVWIMAGR